MTESHEKKYGADDYIKDGVVVFANTGMNLLFLAHGSAIIALLANLEKVKSINLTLGTYFWLLIGGYTFGLSLVLFTIFAAYMCHFNLTQGIDCEVNNGRSREIRYFVLARIFVILSLIIFIVTSLFSIYLAAGMEIHFIASDLLIVMAVLFSPCFVAAMFWNIK